MRRYILPALIFLAGALIGAVALAANKTATLVPPADYTAGGWAIRIYPTTGPGTTATRWCAQTDFCARDGSTGAQDCVTHEVCTTTPPADITAFANARLTAARAANGY